MVSRVGKTKSKGKLKRPAAYQVYKEFGPEIAIRFCEGWKTVIIEGIDNENRTRRAQLDLPLRLLEPFVVELARIRAFVREGDRG